MGKEPVRLPIVRVLVWPATMFAGLKVQVPPPAVNIDGQLKVMLHVKLLGADAEILKVADPLPITVVTLGLAEDSVN